jgi:phosphatidylinositol glycan class B
LIRAVARVDRALLAILGLALALRVAVACWPVIHHADELWQYLETAYHLSVGPWVQTWEAREGTRGWLLPVLLAGPVGLGHWLAPATLLDIILPRLVCALLSLGVVWGAWALGSKASRTHAVIAAAVAATWFEIVYFAPRTLSEPVATSLLVIAAMLAAEKPADRRYVWIGALLGLAAVVRLQYAPAALVLALFACGLQPRDWLRLIVGGAIALVIGGAADLAAGATPFVWAWRSVSANLIANRSAGYGVTPVWDYAVLLFAFWGWAAVPLLFLAAIGARRHPALLAVALVNIAVHSLIPHKEYRFILLSTTLLVILAAIGSVDAMRRISPATRTPMWLLPGWIMLSLACGALGASTREWGSGARLIAAWRIAGNQPQVCGAAIYRTKDALIGSYALYRRGTPIYEYDDAHIRDALASHAFNVVLAPLARSGDLGSYALVSCPEQRGDFCIFSRPGTCIPTADDAPFEVDRFLARRDM